jgi:hypothetical protein
LTPLEGQVISRDDVALLIIRFLEQKILVDPSATTTHDELAIVLISPVRKCAGDIKEAADLIDAACYAAGLPLLGTFRVRGSGGSIDVSGLPAPAWRERCRELQRRDELHRWDSADFAAVRDELRRLAGRSPQLAWEHALRVHRGAALTRALHAGRPSVTEHAVLSTGIAPVRRPPTWQSWRF